MHYNQIPKEHQRKVGMAAGRGSSHSSSASTCRNRRRYVTSPVKQRHEAAKIVQGLAPLLCASLRIEEMTSEYHLGGTSLGIKQILMFFSLPPHFFVMTSYK